MFEGTVTYNVTLRVEGESADEVDYAKSLTPDTTNPMNIIQEIVSNDSTYVLDVTSVRQRLQNGHDLSESRDAFPSRV